MENFNQCEIHLNFENDEKVKLLKNYLSLINNCFNKENKNFAELCYYVYKVKELFDLNYYYSKNERINFIKIMQFYGLNSTDVSRLCSCYDKFLEFDKQNNPVIISNFQGFSKSKLYELLQVPNDQIIEDLKNNVLRYDMSVKTIRDYVKNYQTLQKQNSKLNSVEKEEDVAEEFEEEIPEAYNPKKHYDFEYFENKTKAQLLNIVWQLQCELEKSKKGAK